MKLKLKGRRFDTTEEIQAELQRVLDTLIEKDFRNHSKNEGDGGTCVYVREGTTLRVTAADRPYGEFNHFYVIPEKFGSHIQNFVCTACLRETCVSPVSGNVSAMLINVRASLVQTVH